MGGRCGLFFPGEISWHLSWHRPLDLSAVQALGSDNVKRDPLFYLTIVQKMKVGTLSPHFIYM